MALAAAGQPTADKQKLSTIVKGLEMDWQQAIAQLRNAHETVNNVQQWMNDNNLPTSPKLIRIANDLGDVVRFADGGFTPSEVPASVPWLDVTPPPEKSSRATPAGRPENQSPG